MTVKKNKNARNGSKALSRAKSHPVHIFCALESSLGRSAGKNGFFITRVMEALFSRHTCRREVDRRRSPCGSAPLGMACFFFRLLVT